MSQRYPNPSFARLALAPGLLAAILLLAGVALIDSEWFTIFRYAISILAAIIGVFAFQAKQWWWMPALAVIVVLWNPIVPLELDLFVWQILHLAAAVVFVAAGLLIKVPQAPENASTRR
ncbi:hypothetical protein SAMN06295879_0859 [Agreia bicolorata]|uniref:Uncharacterized protein n=1 Tax=Agreia bicolorata TaxID=110935 RepID=A0A1T4X8V8_9MICO|nr:DUF6804 family protein [Agreia bicolorata]SKA86006.1 hypothetical protein SAMN06295879_0859 [Agreia bicolorata]